MLQQVYSNKTIKSITLTPLIATPLIEEYKTVYLKFTDYSKEYGITLKTIFGIKIM